MVVDVLKEASHSVVDA